MKKLYLVDASNMFFRAFYAIRPLNNSKGLPTNALYGYLNMTIKLLREIRPDYLAYCFDTKEPSFRHAMYEEYKANRTEMPEELIPQIPYFKQITKELGIPIFEMVGMEADDLIGTLTHFGRKERLEVTIVSGDKDFAQLVDPFVRLYDTMKEVVYDEAGVQEKWGIPATKMIDYLALVGDASDNVPGVEGVGPKTASKLLVDYGSLDGVYENIDKIKSDKLREKIRDSKKNAFLSQKLVTIKTDIDLKISLSDLSLKTIDRTSANALLDELEFKSFAKKLFGIEESLVQTSAPTATTQTTANVAATQVVYESKSLTEQEITANELPKYVKPNSSLWGIYTERGVFLSDESKVFILKDEPENLGKVASDLDILWKSNDLKEFWKLIKIKNPQPLWDHHLAAYVIKAGEIGSFSSIYKDTFLKVVPDFPTPTQLIQCNLELEQKLKSKLIERNGLAIYNSIEIPLTPVLYDIETRGIKVDPTVLAKQSVGLTTDIADLEKKIFKVSGESFNISSPKQLSYILFEKLKLDPVRKTKTGYSTDSDVLMKLASQSAICKLIIEYRELAKLKSTYVDVLPQLIDKLTGRLHTSFYQALTATGRLSSSNPNLQNIPVRTERGFAVRSAFVANAQSEFISSDYSQIELRLLAHITGDKGLVGAFERDLDIHRATASEVFGVSLENVTDDMRRMAKAVNFGLAYGMSAHGLAENLNISREEASEIIKKYFIKFAKVQDYMHSTVEFAKKHGYVETELGRRRYIDELKSSNGNIRKFGERAAINAPMQGAASDIVKKAMIDIFVNAKIPMLLQVHDELLFEVEDQDVQKDINTVKSIMENIVKLKVPLRVNVAHGKTWGDI